MTEETPTAIVYANPIDTKVRKSTALEWVRYHAYNFFRRPKVWHERRAVIKIAEGLQLALEAEVYPQADLRCKECREGMAALKGQVFTSNMQMVLQRLACTTHPEAFNRFFNKHKSEFERSEEISAWINGFRK